MARKMRSSPAGGLCLGILVLLFVSPFALADAWRFDNADRIVAVGDVHGAYDALVVTLQKAGVIDGELRWSGGKTHLVSTGDVLDRGADSRRVMDLLMRLEQEAAQSGGRVHLLLGNHEVMNLVGDLRYVDDGEYAAYEDLDTAGDRERWFRHYFAGRRAGGDETAARKAFARRAPPGFFGHRKALRYDGKYGKWLLTKPLIVVINDTAFAHGGLPPVVAERGLAGVNKTLKADLRAFVESLGTLQDIGILNPVDKFREYPLVLEDVAAAGQLTGDALTAGLALVDAGQSPLFGPSGPTWYRGTASCSEVIEADALDRALDAIRASRVVIGHTTTRTLQIQQRLGGRVVEIDTGMLKETYGGSGNALILENGELRSISEDGTLRASLAPHPLRTGHDALEIDEAGLARVLESGQITEVAAAGAAWRLVKVGLGDTTVDAVFRPLPGESRFVPELAAYELDRLLRLGMIPVTVRRDVDGVEGTLQFVPKLALTERERVAAGRGADPACALDKQRDAMLVFDALIDNDRRSPSTILFDPAEWQLMLVDHEGAFGTSPELPGELAGMELVVGNAWREALRSLDDALLRRELGDELSAERLEALAGRRDALIALEN